MIAAVGPRPHFCEPRAELLAGKPATGPKPTLKPLETGPVGETKKLRLTPDRPYSVPLSVDTSSCSIIGMNSRAMTFQSGSRCSGNTGSKRR
jgi:hypothetical protein